MQITIPQLAIGNCQLAMHLIPASPRWVDPCSIEDYGLEIHQSCFSVLMYRQPPAIAGDASV
jgi:hypothetical protein